MNRLARALGASLVLVVVLGSCSQHTDPVDPMDPRDDSPEVVEIEIRNFEFSMPQLTVEVGTTVRWVNTTANFHTVTPDGHSRWTQWQTATTGETFEVTFDATGTFPYYCNPHRALGMTGTVIVR